MLLFHNFLTVYEHYRVSSVFAFFRYFGFHRAKSLLHKFPGPPADSIIFGNLKGILRAEHGAMHEKWAKGYGPVFTYWCLFGQKRLCITDPKSINHILKNVEDFTRPAAEVTELKKWLGNGITASEGAQHKRQLKLISPFFSLSNIKSNANVFEEKSIKATDMYQWYRKVTMDIIGKVAFSQNFNSLEFSTCETELLSILERVISTGSEQLTEFNFVIRTLLKKIPSLQKYIPTERVKSMKGSLDALQKISRKILSKRYLEICQLGASRKDLLSLLVENDKPSSRQENYLEEEVVAQISTFLVAGSETTATFLSWATWMLASHPEIQEKLREEILSARGQSEDCSTDDKLDRVLSLPYLEAVCRETLRLAPPVSSVLRVARKVGEIPLSQPVSLTDGQILDHIPVKPGQTILISFSAYQRREDIFGPCVDVFNPERWLSATEDGTKTLSKGMKNLQTVGVWAGLLAFSAGPKACIGFQFALMEAKVILSTMLTHFKFKEYDERSPILERRGNTVSKLCPGY
ncbi:cytochrome P450 monooxygenase [Phakopsora pachyrhizi]|uniref:Cytochrome P450 monooxygenase n=1 Tax=Phakopsora pachyrhizi TaxID=170000 RepID=A0AAV0BG95_PHAPC|nr:cytochrome P450 monooxygenase [Phakopsora pachyrhizi]CAH7685979.1 cytochrome P450 monooxygenase [Phakopsora pachyrhizi]